MPSFDIVNEIDMQEVENAINNAKKIISTRYDFRGSHTEIELNRKEKTIHIVTEDEMKMRAVKEEVAANLIRRKVDPKTLEYKDIEPTSKGHVKLDAKLIDGIEKEKAKTIVKLIKDLKLKVQTQIQDEQVRVTGKKIDDLQEAIQALKAKDLGIPLQFVNMKS